MSTDYFLACYDCKTRMRDAFASGSGFYGFKVYEPGSLLAWMGHGNPVGTHEGHDVRLVSEHVELPWEYDAEGNWIGLESQT